MSRYTLFLLAVFLISSCKEEKKAAPPPKVVTAGNIMVDSVAIVNNPESNLNVQTNSFVEIDSSGILMFPLSMGESKRNGGSLSYKELPANSYWNIIFHDSKTGQHHLLSDKKMMITNFDYRFNNSDLIDISQTEKYIFYRVIVNDYNNDNVFTLEDPDYLFTSDKKGNNFRQLSPDNYNLISWQYIRASNKILMILTKDSDDNKEFGDKDEVSTFQINIDTDSTATEIFNPEFKNTLKVMYGKDWKKAKR